MRRPLGPLLAIILVFFATTNWIQHSSASSSVPLRVLSWNIAFGKGTDGVTSYDRTATWIASIKPDLAALCEMPADQIPLLVSLLSQKTGQTWYSHFAPKYPGVLEGNLILSKYRFIHTDSRYLSYNRSVAQATVSVAGSTVNFFATHLDPDSSGVRYTQVEQLMSWASGFTESRIVAGDINAGPDTSESILMTSSYYDSWMEAMNMGIASAYSDNPVGMHTRTRRGRIDYIFHSRGTGNLSLSRTQIPDTRNLSQTNVVVTLGTLDDRGVRPSDHNVVVADFDVVTAAAPAPTPTTAPLLLTRGNTDRAIAVHSSLYLAEPFAVWSPFNLSSDLRTRIMLFATNLELFAGESLIVIATDSRGITYDLPVEQVVKVPRFDRLSSVIVRLPEDPSLNGDLTITISFRGTVGNQVKVGIKAQ